MGWQINFWRVKHIQVWIGRHKGFMWRKNLLQFCLKSQMKYPLCWADSAHHSRAAASETHRTNFLIFCSLFSQAFAFLSPDLRWEESTKLMPEGHTFAGQRRIPAEAPCHSTSSLPSVMVSLRSIPPQHPTPALPVSGTEQPQLHGTKDREMKYSHAHTPDPRGLSCDPWDLSKESPLWAISSQCKVEQTASAGWLTAERLLMSISSSLAALAELDLSWERATALS